jgi:hypothetical protein
MNLVRLIDFLRDRLRTVILCCYAFLGLLAALDILRWFLARGHAAAEAPAAAHAAPAAHAAVAAEHAATGFLAGLYHVAETVPVFWSLFGFLACTVIIFFSKKFGHLPVGPKTEIMAREDYYHD